MESHNVTIRTKPLRAFQHSLHSICFLSVFQNHLSAQSLASLRNRKAERGGRQNGVCDKRDRAVTCMFWSFTKRSVERKMAFEAKLKKKKIIVTLTTQGLLSSWLSRPVA